NPANLLNYMRLDEDEAILLDERTLRILKKIQEPVAVITIVGSYSRGKSYFANTLLGRHDGFKLGSSVEGCTKGINIWDTPFYLEGKHVVIIDCEGIDALVKKIRERISFLLYVWLSHQRSYQYSWN
ncbi:39836_t:CDS:2, partial [Gigaspora margarita]